MAAKKMLAKKAAPTKKVASGKAPTPPKRTDSKGRSGMGATSKSRLVPLDYVDQVSGTSGGGQDVSFSGKNVRFRPGIDKVTGGGEGPIRASRTYEAGGKLSKKVTFTRALRQSARGTNRKMK